jgi:hypothetical protein
MGGWAHLAHPFSDTMIPDEEPHVVTQHARGEVQQLALLTLLGAAALNIRPNLTTQFNGRKSMHQRASSGMFVSIR